MSSHRNVDLLNLDNVSENSFNDNQYSVEGRPISDVWSHFVKGGGKVKRNYSASCKYCPKTWNRVIPFKLKANLANECPGCHYSISRFYLDGINQQNSKTVKKKNDAQTLLSNFYESTVLTDQRKNSINKSLLLAFVCCGIPRNVVENPFFIELLKQLRPAYEPPSRKYLSEKLLTDEISLINSQLNTIFDSNDNLTLALDGWSDPKCNSIWNFLIYTSNRQQYLFSVENLPHSSHTGQFLAEKIKEILIKIGPQKFGAIVTDNGSNVKLAREIVSGVCLILDVLHSVNLISKDFLQHSFAKNHLSLCNKVIKFFKKSYQANNILNHYINNNNIAGGGLKKYCRTRWTSAYDTLSSFARLESCFILIVTENSDLIPNPIKEIQFF